jgi:hypothetical protein
MNRRNRIRILGPALLVATALTLPAAVHAAGDPSVMHIDGQFTGHQRSCPELQEHDGKVYRLTGDLSGLRTGDHVRLEGRLVNSRACGGTAVNISTVQAIWADDKHRTTYYDQLQNGSFEQWAAANGRGDRGRRHGQAYDRHNR